MEAVPSPPRCVFASSTFPRSLATQLRPSPAQRPCRPAAGLHLHPTTAQRQAPDPPRAPAAAGLLRVLLEPVRRLHCAHELDPCQLHRGGCQRLRTDPLPPWRCSLCLPPSPPTPVPCPPNSANPPVPCPPPARRLSLTDCCNVLSIFTVHLILSGVLSCRGPMTKAYVGSCESFAW